MSFRRGRGAWFFPSTSSMRPPPSWKLINYLYHLIFSPFLPFFRCRSSCFSSHRYPYSCYPMHERMNNKNGVKGFDDLNVGNKRNVLIPFFNRLSSRGHKVTYRVGMQSQIFLLRKGWNFLHFSWFCCVQASSEATGQRMTMTTSGAPQQAQCSTNEPMWRSPDTTQLGYSLTPDD